MSSIDGTPEPLTYGEALVAIAQATSWKTERQQREVIEVIQAEHGLLPDPVADPTPQDGLTPQDVEINALRAELRRRVEADKKTELDALKAELAATELPDRERNDQEPANQPVVKAKK